MTNKEVYQVFIDFFGEDYVDLQEDKTIIVYFPKVRVTNEYDRYIDIYKLFVRIKLTEGKISNVFELKRAEYTEEQYLSGYCHSHVSFLNGLYDCANWKTPCLGTGPIKNTIASLILEGTEELWQLFCIELKKYIATESIKGVPYMKLESVSNVNMDTYPSLKFVNYLNVPIPFPIDRFLDYIIKQRPFNFNYNNFYGIALSEKNIVITLSNLFIKWYNEGNFNMSITELYNRDILTNCIIKNEKIYIKNKVNIDNIEPLKIITFKNKDIFLNIIKNEKSNKNITILLNHNILDVLVTTLINYINYGTTINKEQRFF